MKGSIWSPLIQRSLFRQQLWNLNGINHSNTNHRMARNWGLDHTNTNGRYLRLQWGEIKIRIRATNQSVREAKDELGMNLFVVVGLCRRWGRSLVVDSPFVASKVSTSTTEEETTGSGEWVLIWWFIYYCMILIIFLTLYVFLLYISFVIKYVT